MLKNKIQLEKEQQKDLIKIIISVVLLVTAFAIEKIASVENFWIRLVLYIVPYAVAGYEIIKEAVENILHGELFDENFLMTIAGIGAFAIGECPEAVMIVLLYSVGEFFEDIAVDKSKESVAELLSLTSDEANVIRNGEIVKVKAEEVAVGERIIVKAGEKVALDGVIVEGESVFDMSALSGESLPVNVSVGSVAISASLNLTNAITIEVTKEYADSTASVIQKTVENAVEQKPKVDKFITRFSKIYTPVVVAVALLISFAVPLIIGESISEWIRRGLMLLVISCPCALVVSVPLSFFVGIGRAAKKGVLVKGCDSIESLSQTSVAVFDKTGTLTKGRLAVVSCVPNGISEEELANIAASVEKYSSHPIAKAICAFGKSNYEVTDVSEISGKGIIATLDGKQVVAGNAKLLAEYGFTVTSSGTSVHVALGENYLGCITVADEIKDNAVNVISALKASGVKKTVMLSGDNKSVAENVASTLGIDIVEAELLPAEKSEKIKQLRPAYGKLLFAGDGINDAPALAIADVGVAMGSGGADIAIEIADAVIMDDNLAKLPFLIRLAKKTMLTVKENIFLSLAVKLIVFALSLFGIMNLWLAVFADVGTLVIAIINAVKK